MREGIVLFLPLGYSAVCDYSGKSIYKYRVRHGALMLGVLSYSPSTRTYAWEPVVGTPTYDITDPKEIPYGT